MPEGIAEANPPTGRVPGSWLYVLPWEPTSPGGVSEVVNNMLPRTEAVLGRSPVLIVNDWASPRPVPVQGAAFRTVRIRVPVPAGGIRQALGALVRLPLAVMRLTALMRQERAAVVNPHFPDLSAVTWLLAARLSAMNPKVVLAFHGLDAQHVMSTRGLARLCWRWALRAADHLVVCSPTMREGFVRFGVPHGRISTVDNGIDPKALAEQAAPAPALTLPSRYIVSVGTYEHKKGHDVLLLAFDRLAARHPGVSLVIIGRRGTGDYLSKLDSQRRNSSEAERIVFLSDVEHGEAMRIVRRANVFALASRVEPFGIAILEAAALGVPAVATTVCGAVQRLGNDLLAVVGPDDEVSLSKAIETLLSDRVAAQEKARLLQARVLDRFTWDKVMASWPCSRTSSAA